MLVTGLPECGCLGFLVSTPLPEHLQSAEKPPQQLPLVNPRLRAEPFPAPAVPPGLSGGSLGLVPKLAFELPVSALGHPNPLEAHQVQHRNAGLGFPFSTVSPHCGCVGNAR